jgi:hypothetical protein
MKKPKISLDPQVIQTFLLNHIEKILLVIVVMLMLGLVWRGMTLPHLKDGLAPEKMVTEANQTKQYIEDQNRWNEVSLKPERQVDFDVVRKVGEVQQKSNPLAYSLPNPWSRPDFPKLSPRQDPELYAPINLVVRPVVGPLASFINTYSTTPVFDPLYPEKSEEDLKKEREKKRMEEKKKKKDNLASDFPGSEGMPGGPGGPGGKAKRGKASRNTEDSMAGPGARGGPRGGAPMPGGDSGGYGATGPLTVGAPYPEAHTYGYSVQAADATMARDMAAVTIMAVVPFQKQVDEFDKKLANSLDYDPSRDVPQYAEFQVQRVDVTDLDPNAPIDEALWKYLPKVTKVLEEQAFGNEKDKKVPLFAGAPAEVSDPSYLEPETLTHYAPPFLQRDLWDLLTHPDVPLYTPVLQLTDTGTAAAGAGQDNDAPSMGALMNRPGMGSGYSGDSAGGFGGGRMPMPGGPGAASRPGGGMPGSAMGGMRSGGAMMSRPGFNRGGEDSAYGGGYGGMQQNYTPPKYKLIRFTDTYVERGKKYRYRIRVFLADPNHPLIGITPPSSASLHPDVQKRVKELDVKDAEETKKRGYVWRTYWITSPWSEPSPVAELPSPARVFAVKVTPRSPQKVTINGKPIDVPIADPTADAYTVVFDDRKIADVPAESDKITRGSVLNYEVKETHVIHPVTKDPVKLEKYNIHSDLVVADLMGGERLPTVDTKSLTTPFTALGEMLVVDAEGRLHVHNESQDIEGVRRFTVVKEDPNKPKPPADTGEAGVTGDAPRGRKGRPGCF